MLKSIFQYVELTTRVRGKKSFMLVKSDYDAMLAAESIQTILRRLEGTRYQPFISKLLVEEFDLGKVEENLTKAYQAELDFILSKLRNKNALRFFQEFYRSLELKSLASLLKSIILNIEWEQVEQYIVPYGRFDLSTCKGLVESKNIKTILESIEEEPLREEVERILREVEDPTRQILEIEVALERYSSMRVWEKLMELKGRDRHCINLVGITIDMLNIMTILRLKKLGFKPEEIERFIITIYHRLSEKDVRRAMLTPTEKDAVKALIVGYYVDVISPLISTYEVKEDLSLFEIALKRYHVKECERIFFLQFFHLGEALAYLYLRWYELRDLITLILGKYFGLPSDKIESSLILHQPPYPIG